jgi:ribosome recycling factor
MLNELIELILEDTREHMDKTLSFLKAELNAIRAGRASPMMLQNVRVDYYGTQTPLNQMASVNAPQPDLIVVQPWDNSSLSAIEKAIIAENLGLNPSNDGQIIRVPVPPLSEERRRDLVKSARRHGEDAKISIRNIRRSAKDNIKTTQEEESLSEDMRYLAEDQLQTTTDDYIAKIDQILERKEEEIMEV